ncbi:MAG: response regulator [Microcoleus sp.]
MSYVNCCTDWESSSGKKCQGLMDKLPLVLAVDDNRDNLDLLTEVVDLLGCECVQAANGYTALAVAFDRPVDLIILDICLPDLDGVELINRLKANPKLANIPIIAITALAKTEDRDRILLAGCAEYLTKPFNIDELEIIIHRHLKSRQFPVEF